MHKPLVYLDQNVIGLAQAGEIDLSGCADIQWVYSKEHFAEIRRSRNSEPYISQLTSFNAKLLDLELDSRWQITGAARVLDGPAHYHYERYLDALAEVPVDETIFDPFQAWLNGGGDDGLFKMVPTAVAEQVSSLLGLGSGMATAAPDTRFQDTIDQLLAVGNDPEVLRRALGLRKGAAGSASGQNPLAVIWELVADHTHGLTCDQFFGFEPLDKQGYEVWPTYLGIVGCCAVLDLVGFQAEKKCRRVERIANVRSDATHIGMGAFCGALITADKRLARRASAIFAYKEIGTRIVLLDGAKKQN